jgi:hypothetical protein
MRDKALHFIAGAAVAAPVAWLGYPVHSVLLAGFSGIAKEVWDYRGNGTPELADFIATLTGAIAGAVALA